MRFDIQNAADITLVRCSGRIVQGDGTDELLRTVMAQDSPRIQLDLSRVNAIDAGGLGALARLARWAKDGSRLIELVNPTRRVRAAVESTRLSSVLKIRCLPQSRGEAA